MLQIISRTRFYLLVLLPNIEIKNSSAQPCLLSSATFGNLADKDHLHAFLISIKISFYFFKLTLFLIYIYIYSLIMF